MKRNWTEEELVERWTLFPDELALAGIKAQHTRVGFAVLIRFFAGEGYFPRDKSEVPIEVLRFGLMFSLAVRSARQSTFSEGPRR